MHEEAFHSWSEKSSCGLRKVFVNSPCLANLKETKHILRHNKYCSPQFYKLLSKTAHIVQHATSLRVYDVGQWPSPYSCPMRRISGHPARDVLLTLSHCNWNTNSTNQRKMDNKKCIDSTDRMAQCLYCTNRHFGLCLPQRRSSDQVLSRVVTCCPAPSM